VDLSQFVDGANCGDGGVLVAYVLIVVFVAIPHLRMSGKPLMLLDIPAREFVVRPHVFPTDTLAVGVGDGRVVRLDRVGHGESAVGCGAVGRVRKRSTWNFCFDPSIGCSRERRVVAANLDGLTGVKRTLRWGIYLVLSMVLAHTFLAYFVGTEQLAQLDAKFTDRSSGSVPGDGRHDRGDAVRFPVFREQCA
jgi:hypothetical protein